MKTESASNKLKIIVVGLGHQSLDDHIPAIEQSDHFELVGVVDINAERAREIGELKNITFAVDTETLLKQIDYTPDAALVAVPHSGYLPIIAKLAENSIHVIKEKPFAVSIEDALEIKKLVKEHDITLQVTLQRRFNPIFRSFQQLVKRVGKLHSIEARYTLNISRLDEGWRASRLYSGGGSLIDLGYHYIDLIIWYFGLPDSVTCKLSTGNRDEQVYDVEDTAFIDFSYNDSGGNNERILGSLIVSRVYPDKEESLIAYGSKGSVAVRRGQVVRRDIDGNELECLTRTGSWPSALIDQLDEFAENIMSSTHNGYIEDRYFEQVALVDAAYKSADLHKSQNPHDSYKQLKNDRL
ncbi:MAG: Gfo/Idh/MocA family oxidoreductase [bacterium]